MSNKSMVDKKYYSVFLGALTFLLWILAPGAKAQNMMSEMNDLQNLSWYQEHFQGLEDSVVHYQEVMKQPQVPAERRNVLEKYQWHLTKYRAQLRSFILEHRQDEMGAKALLISCFREVEVNADTLAALGSLLEGEGAGNKYASYLKQELAGRQNNQVGKTFIDFEMKDLNGQPVNSGSFRGKYLLVDFWASWCGPCRAEMPSLLAVYHQFKDGSLVVMAVSVDTDEKSWRKAVAQDATDWMNVYDHNAWSSKVVRDYAVHRIPQNILIGPDGRIVAKNISALGLTKILTKVQSTGRAKLP